MSTPVFKSALSRFQFRWRAGLLLSGLLRGAILVAVAFVLIGVFDYYGGLSDAARIRVAQLFAGLIVFGVVWALWDAITFMKRDAAVQADTALDSSRRVALSSYELAPASVETPLAKWLRERSLESASSALKKLPLKRSFPLRRIRGHFLRAVGVAGIILALAYGNPAPFRVITARLLHPREDIPPYSPYQFAITPQPAEVLYGGELLLTATVTGAVPDLPVRCLTRDPATKAIEESPAFQETTGRFSRKLEKVAAPVEVAFAIGRARSGWVPVQVRTQPKLEEALLTVEAPTYSGRPKQEFILGTQALSVLPGSRVTAQLTSNRPLAGGVLRLAANGEAARELPGEKVDVHRVRFTWVARSAALLTFRVKDIRDTDSDPLSAEQKILLDERPDVVIRQPSGDILATQDTEIPLEGNATDDYGLTRIAIVRKLVGYRERSVSEAVPRGERRHDIIGKLNLAAFGVLPGQTIEVSLEAADTNPNLLGVSVSETARIHIIPRERYAEMLRNATTLEDFAARYEALQQALEDSRKALNELEAAAKTGDPAKVEAARKKAFEAHQQSAQVFGQIAKDFPIFDLDEGLAAASKDVAERLLENGKDLDALKGAKPQDMAAAVPELKKRLGEAEQKAGKEIEKGQRAAAAGKAIEQMGRFKELLEKQRLLVRDFNRTAEQVRRGETDGAAALKELARRQREIASGLRDFEKEMGAALDQLPPGFEQFGDEARKFLNLLKNADVPPVMDDAAKFADASDSRQSNDKATEALRRLEELLKKGNKAGDMMAGNGDGDDQFPWPEDLKDTMRQLMQGLIPRPGQGQGQGQGNAQNNQPGMGERGGGSGTSDSGFSMPGKMPRLPMYGPPRSSFAKRGQPGMAGGKQGRGEGQGQGPGHGNNVGGNALGSSETRKKAGEAAAVESIPETYREAAKRYFAPEPEKATP